MHAAPAVGVRCAGGAAWRAFQSLLPGAAAAALVAWLLLPGPAPAVGGVVLPAVLAAAALVAAICWRLVAPVAVDLRWDGRCWTADGQAGALDVMIDLGGWMLLRLRPEDRAAARWIPVAAAEAGAGWPALRAAALSGGDAADPAAPSTAR